MNFTALRIILLFLIMAKITGCSPAKKIKRSDDMSNNAPAPKTPTPIVSEENASEMFFSKLFKDNPGKFDAIEKNRKAWNVQIIYTQINRDKNGNASLTNFYFNKEDASYFYPASTVKLPIVLLALQKLNASSAKAIDKNTAMISLAAYSGQTAVYNDPNTANGNPTVAQYIKKILLVSDNDAYNRLYEFLGQEYINSELQKKGYSSAEILHRLEVYLTDDENRHTNPVSFYSDNNALLYAQPMLVNKKQYSKRSDFMGNGYYSNGKYIDKPMVFSNKNRLGLEDLQTIFQSVIFPESVKANQRFNISEEDRKFVLKYMSSFPGEAVNPYYDSSYDDAYGKFIFYGGEAGKQSKNIRVFNKSGDAYGQLTDVAYVVDYAKKIEFMVSATIYCNSDGVLNDDKYDYKTIGLPFMKNLGRALYDYESGRKKNHLPDLSSFMFAYDK